MNLPIIKKMEFKIALIGAGSRGTQYSSHALKHGGTKIVAVVDPNEFRRNIAAEKFNIDPKNCFPGVDELLERGVEFDGVINGTMDNMHVKTTLPLLQRGKCVMLEKPMCLNKDELFELYNTTVKYNAKLMVCHVLRYTPFYSAIKQRVVNGEIGEIKHIYASESVANYHMAAAFIRGKWGNSVECGSKILMAKSCHDMDLLTWFKSGVRPVKVSSMGSLFEYKAEKAPKGAGKKCIVDCKIESECPYSANLNYLKRDDFDVYSWRDILEKGTDLSGKTIPFEEKVKYLKSDDRFGRCVYYLDNDQYDTQNVSVQFEDGSVATFGLDAGTPYGERYIRLEGTKGMIIGQFMKQQFIIRKPKLDLDERYTEEVVDINCSLDGHGGGDTRIIGDFINLALGNETSISCTSIEDSMYGHLIGFNADISISEERIVRIEKL